MKGSIVERNGRYSAVVSYKDGTGKWRQVWKAVDAKKKGDVQKVLNQMLHEIDMGVFIRPDKQTLGDYLTAWLRDTALPNLSPRTFEGYEYNIKKHILPFIGAVPLAQLTPQQIQRLCGEKQSAGHNRTAEYIYFTLRKALRDAVKMGLLARNPTDALSPPKVARREMHTLGGTDIHIVLEYSKSGPYYPLFYTALFTGLRRSEILALRWSDCDLLLGKLYVTRTMHQLRYGQYKGQVIYKQPKTASGRRMIALTPSNISVLTEHRAHQDELRHSLDLPLTADEDFIFCNVDNTPYLPDGISHAWLKLVRRCGLKGIRLHDTRHSHASLLLRQGVHPKIVAERLGHNSIETTIDTYSHVAPGIQEKAALSFDDMVVNNAKNPLAENKIP